MIAAGFWLAVRPRTEPDSEGGGATNSNQSGGGGADQVAAVALSRWGDRGGGTGRGAVTGRTAAGTDVTTTAMIDSVDPTTIMIANARAGTASGAITTGDKHRPRPGHRPPREETDRGTSEAIAARRGRISGGVTSGGPAIGVLWRFQACSADRPQLISRPTADSTAPAVEIDGGRGGYW